MMKRVKRDETEMMQQLMEDGYLVVENVLDAEQCAGLVNEFFGTLSVACPDIRQEDPTTYSREKLPHNQQFLLQHFNIGFWQHAVHTRSKTVSVFERLWGDADLMSSFDATSFSVKTAKPTFANVEDWERSCWAADRYHLDETRDLDQLDYISVQSGVSLWDQEEAGHVFVCVPGAHRYYKDLIKFRTSQMRNDLPGQRAKHDSALKKGPAKKTLEKRHREDEFFASGENLYNGDNWWVLDSDAKEFLRSKNLKPKRVPLKAGSMVFWVSHMPHTSSLYCETASKDARRLQVFIAMVPRSFITNIEEQKKIRQMAYQQGIVSKHSPDYVRLFSKSFRPHSVEDKQRIQQNPPSYADMTEAEKRLHGLDV
jgi:hypothetical protein